MSCASRGEVIDVEEGKKRKGRGHVQLQTKLWGSGAFQPAVMPPSLSST